VEVPEATGHRIEQLVEQGLAERQARGLVFSHNLIDTLRRREVEALGEKLAAEILRADPSRVLLGIRLRWFQYFCAPLRRAATRCCLISAQRRTVSAGKPRRPVSGLKIEGWH
jgi:hypothetical protein